ncbi:MAG: hypothetical protein U9Q85_04170 [Patescibacteria group bacterium]|nr:hypothetical protein [Patescibacteria group bacterium]
MNQEDTKQKAKQLIDDIFGKIDEYKAKSIDLKDDTKEVYDKQIANLEEKKEDLQEKLASLTEASEDKWEEVNKAFEASIDSFKKGFSELAKPFSKDEDKIEDIDWTLYNPYWML